jgi:integrase
VASVYKPKGSANYVISWRGADGRMHKQTACPDRATSKRIAAKKVEEEAQRKAGLITPAAEKIAKAAAKPVAEHLDAFIAIMKAKQSHPKHVCATRTYLERIVAKTEAAQLSDLTLDAVTLAIDSIAQELGLSARAYNAHVTAIYSFVRWCCKTNRIVAHELEGLGKRDIDAGRRYVRRPLTADELRRLIATTKTAPTWRGITGQDRAMFYLLGAATGLRRSELGSLHPEDFDLQGPMPFVCLDGSRTKSKKECNQPLQVGLVGELKAWLATKPPGKPVFALPEKTARMIQRDLKRAGIEPVDAKGRVVDTHSLRHGYISALARARLPLKVTQELARHSDPKLTMNVYAHVNVHDLHGAVADALPDLTALPDQSAMSATGTDGVALPPALPEEEAGFCNSGSGKGFTSNSPQTRDQLAASSF